jgi:hypothetical protein
VPRHALRLHQAVCETRALARISERDCDPKSRSQADDARQAAGLSRKRQKGSEPDAEPTETSAPPPPPPPQPQLPIAVNAPKMRPLEDSDWAENAVILSCRYELQSPYWKL